MQSVSQAIARVAELKTRAGVDSPPPGAFDAALAAHLEPGSDRAAVSSLYRVGSPMARPITIGELIGAGQAGAPRIRSVDGIMSSFELADYKALTGIEHRNGHLSDLELTPISGGWNGRTANLLPPAAAAWEVMRRAALADGVDLQFVDAYRSYEVQDAAHRRHLSGDKPEHVLAPGTSQHGLGLAVDLTDGSLIGPGDPQWNWMNANASLYGWHPISNESWHWEFRGA